MSNLRGLTSYAGSSPLRSRQEPKSAFSNARCRALNFLGASALPTARSPRGRLSRE